MSYYLVEIKKYFLMIKEQFICKTKKRTLLAIGGVFISTAIIWVLYQCFAHQIVKAIYEGRCIEILKSLITYRHVHPVEHYLSKADRLFYGTCLPLIFAIPFLSLFSKFIFTTVSNSGNSATTGYPISNIESSDSTFHRSNIAIIFFISLGVRIILLPLVTNLPLAGDEVYYWSIPKLLASGDLVGTIVRPPLWGYLLSIPAVVSKNPFAGRVFSSIIGTCTPVLICLLTTKVFNKKTGIVAALMYAVYPVHIGYSHYLWSELLFGFISLLSIYLFFLFIKENKKSQYLYLSAIIASLALLTKELAVIFAAGFLVTLFRYKVKNMIKKTIICGLIFILPAFVYSSIISCVTDQLIILNDAPIANFRIAAGLEKGYNYEFENRGELKNELISFLKKRNLKETLKNMCRQFSNLWTPNSFPIHRLLSGRESNWGYEFPAPWLWVYLIAGSYVFIVVTGIAGLSLTTNNPFKTFSAATILCLSLISILVFFISRFRLPFMFIFIMFSAHFLLNWKILLPNLRKFGATAVLLILLKIFSKIVIDKWDTFGQWG